MTAAADAYLDREFGLLSDLIALHARERPAARALVLGEAVVLWGELDALVDRIAAALQAEGLGPGGTIAICAATSIPYAATFLAGLRAGVGVAPMAPSCTPEQLEAMVSDSGAPLFFVDGAVRAALEGRRIPARFVTFDDSDGGTPFSEWLARTPEGAKPAPVTVDPKSPFNIIYSSGTTGTPKGIVQSHAMRWAHINRGAGAGYGPDAVTLLSTPLYSNTTLVSFFPTMGLGGCAVLMPKFDTLGYLELAQKHRATHTMLVPVQYRRLMEHPDFDRYDLSSFVMKFCTSAPFAGALKADILARWPGGLIEYFGMTEGGGGCALIAHAHPDKLHTVGQPLPGHDIRLIDEEGNEVGVGEVGEIVGRSGAVMNGYWNRPEQTAAAQWRSPDGQMFIRTGDVGRFDADGFLTLMDRKKDMVISGGFNIYPSDLEAVLAKHPDLAEAAVFGVPSHEWGETPVAAVVAKPGAKVDPGAVKDWVNGQVGKTQRLSEVRMMDALPRSAIGKVLKRELRDAWVG